MDNTETATNIQRFVRIFLIISGKAKKQKNGVYRLTESGREKVRESIEKNLHRMLPTLKPDFFFCSERADEMETLDLLTGLLEYGNNGKSKIAYRGLNIVLDPGKMKIFSNKSWEERARNCAKLSWLDHRLFWRKKIRATHWLTAGGDMAKHIKSSIEPAVKELVRYIASNHQSNDEQIGIITGQADYFNLPDFNHDLLPPLSPGDIIRYKFIVDGKDVKSAKITDDGNPKFLPA